MASRINFKNIIGTLNAESKLNNTIRFNDLKTSSSDKFDNKFANVIEHFAPYIISVVSHFYCLENSESELSKSTIEKLENFSENLQKSYFAEEGLEDNYEFVMSFLKPFTTLKVTRYQFIQRKDLMFDDTGASHLAAFNIKSKAELPQNNIVLKFRMSGEVHIRCGLEIKNISDGKVTVIVTLRDIVNKKTGNN